MRLLSGEEIERRSLEHQSLANCAEVRQEVVKAQAKLTKEETLKEVGKVLKQTLEIAPRGKRIAAIEGVIECLLRAELPGLWRDPSEKEINNVSS